MKIAETAYNILKCETELNQKMEASIRAKRNLRDGQSKASHNASTLEGGQEI